MNTIDIRIFSYDDKSWKSKISIWNITEERLDKECCIYNWAIYWKEDIPDGIVVKNNPTLRDVWNLECYDGWQCTKYMRDQFESFKNKKD